jgi:hypothetical protein
MEQVLQLAVVVFAALATGGLMVNWIGLGRAMSRLSVSTYVEFHQATNHTFDPYMPIVVVGAFIRWRCARDCPRNSFALRRIGHRWIRLLCRSLGDCLIHKRPDQQTDRTLASSEPAR